jgi:hypothetical protein
VPINTSGLKIYLVSSDKEDMGTKLSVTGLTDVAVTESMLMLNKTMTGTSYVSLHIMMKNVIFLQKFMERKG